MPKDLINLDTSRERVLKSHKASISRSPRPTQLSLRGDSLRSSSSLQKHFSPSPSSEVSPQHNASAHSSSTSLSRTNHHDPLIRDQHDLVTQIEAALALCARKVATVRELHCEVKAGQAQQQRQRIKQAWALPPEFEKRHDSMKQELKIAKAKQTSLEEEVGKLREDNVHLTKQAKSAAGTTLREQQAVNEADALRASLKTARLENKKLEARMNHRSAVEF